MFVITSQETMNLIQKAKEDFNTHIEPLVKELDKAADDGYVDQYERTLAKLEALPGDLRPSADVLDPLRKSIPSVHRLAAYDAAEYAFNLVSVGSLDTPTGTLHFSLARLPGETGDYVDNEGVVYGIARDGESLIPTHLIPSQRAPYVSAATRKRATEQLAAVTTDAQVKGLPTERIPSRSEFMNNFSPEQKVAFVEYAKARQALEGVINTPDYYTEPMHVQERGRIVPVMDLFTYPYLALCRGDIPPEDYGKKAILVNMGMKEVRIGTVSTDEHGKDVVEALAPGFVIEEDHTQMRPFADIKADYDNRKFIQDVTDKSEPIEVEFTQRNRFRLGSIIPARRVGVRKDLMSDINGQLYVLQDDPVLGTVGVPHGNVPSDWNVTTFAYANAGNKPVRTPNLQIDFEEVMCKLARQGYDVEALRISREYAKESSMDTTERAQFEEKLQKALGGVKTLEILLNNNITT